MEVLDKQNAYGHQHFQGVDMLQGALTRKYAWHQHSGLFGVA